MGCICSRETVQIGDQMFYVRQRLGEGGFSVVDLVEESRSHKVYALKRIACHSREDEEVAEKEVQYMLSVQHPNLVPCEAHSLVALRSTGPALNRSAVSEMLIIMPYYWKGSLQNEIEALHKKQQQMAEKRVLRILKAICQGLKALHTLRPRALAHRDIKPQNVMYDVDDTPVLMDFGSMGPATIEIKNLSDALKIQDFAAERCSMPYRAPELFNVESQCVITEKTDIWSLGCLLYAMCYHESPFDKVYQRGDSIALAAMAGKIDIPKQSRYSRDITELMLAMLKVKPTDRPDAEQILQQIVIIQNKADNRV